MRKLAALTVAVLTLALLAGTAGVVSILGRGLGARDEPTRLEVLVARELRHLAVPGAARGERNPVAVSPEVLVRARAHFADHCASCHGNDGRGRTTLGQSLYPRAPDMTLADTQRLSDGELFSIIENGVRLTGMPAWGVAGAHDATESWELVHFIRHLPQLTAQELVEMQALNPRSRRELEEEAAEQKFLAGEGDPPPAAEEGHPH